MLLFFYYYALFKPQRKLKNYFQQKRSNNLKYEIKKKKNIEQKTSQIIL